MTIYHKHGGRIVSLDRIAHETYRGVASWEFIGRVEWRDGGVSEAAHIAPWALCFDDEASETSRDEVGRAMGALDDYLQRNGQWHEEKQKRDGRIYHWTPHKPNGSEPYSND